MRKTLLFSSLLTVFLVASVTAVVPQIVSYQGRLTDTGGDPVSDGSHFVKFAVYPAAIGGADLWNSGFQNITTQNGLFSYDLGSNVPLPDDLFTDTSRYLGITVGGDLEISPRTRLESSPYAYHALRADTALFSASSAGLTQSIREGAILMNGYLSLMSKDSINCPADGYVMVNVTLGMNCNHSGGDDDLVFVMITDSTYTVLDDQNNRAWSVASSWPSDFYYTFVHIHKVFPVSAGWNRFNIIGSPASGGGTDNFSSSDLTTSLLFVPNSFGSVTVGTPSPPNSRFNSLPFKSEVNR